MIIELTTHGSSIHRRRERFVIKTPDQKDAEIPAEKTDTILVSSNAMISTSAIRLCIERQIQLVITSWSGKPLARIWSSALGRQTQIRRQQYLNADTKFAFSLTKKLLSEKLSKQRQVLTTLRQNRKQEQLRTKLHDAASFIADTETVIKIKPYQKHYAQQFLGHEGSCATLYFQMISACLAKKWQFKKRTQNPGLDEFNVALNYMYGLTYSSVEKVIILCGLDPNSGFYHKDHYGKPTLAYDLIEPCRPVIDRVLLSLFNRKIVNDGWFSKDLTVTASMQLSKTGRTSLISSYKQDCQKIVEKTVWKYCKDMTADLLRLDRAAAS